MNSAQRIVALLSVIVLCPLFNEETYPKRMRVTSYVKWFVPLVDAIFL